MSTDAAAGAPRRSVFVTVVAWVVIAFAGMTTLITALQSVFLFAVVPLDELHRAENVPDVRGGFARLVVTHPEWWVVAWLVVSAVGLASAIGLLRRSERARVVFVALLGLGTLWSLASPFLAAGMMPADFFDTGSRGFVMVARVMWVFTVVMAVGFAALFAWLAWRLCSAEIRAEFRPGGSNR